MLATPSSSSYVLVDDVCARLRAVEELGFVDRDGIVDRLRAEELPHIGENRILVGECDLDHAIEVYLKPGLHELFIPVHVATRRLPRRRADRPESQYGDFAVLVWVDGSYILFVEPRLIGNFDIVSVRVADVCREVVGTPFGPKARFLD